MSNASPGNKLSSYGLVSSRGVALRDDHIAATVKKQTISCDTMLEQLTVTHQGEQIVSVHPLESSSSACRHACRRGPCST